MVFLWLFYWKWQRYIAIVLQLHRPHIDKYHDVGCICVNSNIVYDTPMLTIHDLWIFSFKSFFWFFNAVVTIVVYIFLLNHVVLEHAPSKIYVLNGDFSSQISLQNTIKIINITNTDNIPRALHTNLTKNILMTYTLVSVSFDLCKYDSFWMHLPVKSRVIVIKMSSWHMQCTKHLWLFAW